MALEQTGATSVHISWEPADEIPLVQYQVYHNKEGRGQVGVVGTEETSITVQNLGVHLTHGFRVSAVFLEVDGKMHELAKSEALEVYLPGVCIL